MITVIVYSESGGVPKPQANAVTDNCYRHTKQAIVTEGRDRFTYQSIETDLCGRRL